MKVWSSSVSEEAGVRRVFIIFKAKLTGDLSRGDRDKFDSFVEGESEFSFLWTRFTI